MIRQYKTFLLENNSIRHYKKGDRIKIIEGPHTGEIGIIFDKFANRMFDKRGYVYEVQLDYEEDRFFDDEIELYDDIENSDREEWLEESNGHKFNIGDKVICIQPISKNQSYFNLNPNQVYKITGFNSLDTLNVDGSSIGYNKERFKLYDDSEESNYVKWIDESHDYDTKFQVGDRVKIIKIIEINPDTKKEYEKDYLGKIGKIDIVQISRDHPYSIIFNIPGIPNNSFKEEELELVEEIEDSNYEEWLEESTEQPFKFHLDEIVKIKVFKDKKGVVMQRKHFPYTPNNYTNSNYYKIRTINSTRFDWFFEDDLIKVDDFEETNYEEWLEESKQINYNIGDKVIIKKFNDVNYYELNYDVCGVGINTHMISFGGEIAKIRNVGYTTSTYGLSDLKNNIIPGSWCYDMIYSYDDELEDSDYEEWVEE